MKWFRVNSDPVTAQRQVLVENARGQQGFIGITPAALGARFYGAVYAVLTEYDPEGTPVWDKKTLLDPYPEICTASEVLAN